MKNKTRDFWVYYDHFHETVIEYTETVNPDDFCEWIDENLSGPWAFQYVWRQPNEDLMRTYLPNHLVKWKIFLFRFQNINDLIMFKLWSPL
jgi:hypothetical protein